MKPPYKYFYTPNILSNDDDWMRDWVVACVSERKNGASDDEVRRLVKRLRRMVPVLAEAVASEAGAPASEVQGSFERTLLDLRVPHHG